MTIYTNKVLATQRRVVSTFVADNYFPVTGELVTLTNQSIESVTNDWSLFDGVTTVHAATLNASVQPLTTAPLLQQLDASNLVSTSAYKKSLYPIVEPTRVYPEIAVDHQVLRLGSSFNLTSNDHNVVAGATLVYTWTIKNAAGTVVSTLTGKTQTVTLVALGIYDFTLVVTTNGSPVTQTKKKLVTITPTLGNIGTATICELTPGVRMDFGNGSIPPGTTIIIREPASPPANPEYRLSLNDLHGTALNPIVITVDSATPLQFNFWSYYGINMYNCSHVVFDGRGYNNLEYGLHIRRYQAQPQAIIGMSVGYLCTDIQVFGIEFSLMDFAGLNAKTDPDKDEPQTWRGNYTFYNFYLHHNFFHNTGGEANYIGYFNSDTYTVNNSQGQLVTYRAHALSNAKVYRNTYYRIGFDAIQFNNGIDNSEICYNDILESGIYREQDQASFMSLGLDGAVYDNTMINSGGVGIQWSTYVEGINIYNNTMTEINPGSPAFLFLNSRGCPDQNPNGDDTNPTTPIWLFNNTVICEGKSITAQAVIAYSNIRIFNNALKFVGSLTDLNAFGSSTATATNNYQISDDGTTPQIANIDDNDLQISSNSILINLGIAPGAVCNSDKRGYDAWETGTYHVGAYSGYRRLSTTTISLTSFTLNGGASTTDNKIVTATFTYTGTPTEYIISEDPGFAGAVWTIITDPINFTLSEPDGLKTVYFRIKNAGGAMSTSLSDTITLNRSKTILIDLGSNNPTYQTGPSGAPPTTAQTWNNLFSATGTDPVVVGTNVVLKDTLNNVTGYTITVTTEFSIWETNGGPEVITPAPLYPYTAYRDSFQANVGTTGAVTITGLTPAKPYTVKCFGARGFVDNRTLYDVNGNVQPLLTRDNLYNVVTFTNVIPNGSNAIVISVSGDPLYTDDHGIISVIEISETA